MKSRCAIAQEQVGSRVKNRIALSLEPFSHRDTVRQIRHAVIRNPLGVERQLHHSQLRPGYLGGRGSRDLDVAAAGPVNSSPPPSSTPAGWYPDPWGQAPLRWWGGQVWTAHLTGPEQPHPQFTGPPPVDASEQVDLAAGTAAWLTKLVLIMPAVIFGTIVGFGVAFRRVFDLIEDFDTSPGADPDEQFEQFFDSFGAIAGGFAAVQFLNLIALAVLVMRMVWTYRMVNAARTIGRGGSREPGLACAGWIIPVVNLWFPYQTMRDLFPADERPSSRLTTWWITYIFGLLGTGATVLAMFLPVGGLIAVAVVAAVPVGISASFERRLVTEATELLRRDVDAA